VGEDQSLAITFCAKRSIIRVQEPDEEVADPKLLDALPKFVAAADLWKRVAESFVGGEALRDATDQVAPWENWFSHPEHIASALAGAGLKQVHVERRDYHVPIAATEYLAEWRVADGAGL
jgi:hypothetical protein